jgi:carboxypeptidase family protein
MRGVTGMVAALAILSVLPSAARAQRATSQPVTGVAIDTTGAVLPNADVVLTTTSGGTVQQTTTGAAGNFRFDAVPQGRYEVRVAFEGFQPTTSRVTVGARAPSPLRITLTLASLKQEVTVSNQAAEVTTGAATNSDAVTIDQAMLDSLPVFDQDLISTVSRFLDAGALTRWR